MAFSTFLRLCSHHHNLASRKFSSPQRETLFPWSCHFLSPPPSNPWQPLISLPSWWICLIWIFHINGIMWCMASLWLLWVLSYSIMLLSFIHVVLCATRHHSFSWLNTIPCVFILHLFISWWTFGLFVSFGCWNNAAVNICILLLFEHSF